MTLVMAASCDLANSLSNDSSDVVRKNWVVNELAAQIGTDGKFVSIAAIPEYPTELSKGSIEALGTMFVHTIPRRPGGLEADIVENHGAPIDFTALQICGRSFYMKSSFQPIDPSLLAYPVRNEIGGQWNLTYCSPSGTPTVLQNVYGSTHVTTVNGNLVFPPEAAGDFYSFGIRLSTPVLVRSPETAVARVFAVTKTRISKLPEMFHDLASIGPTGANGRPFDPYWKVEVETPVTVTTAAQGSIQARVFYVLAYSVLFDDAVYVAGAIPLPPFWAQVLNSGGVVDSVRVIPREPLNFERVLTPN